jgi:tetratricopeptide (TPR) repeat protein
MESEMRALFLSLICSSFLVSQEPAELWTQGERARAVEAQRAALIKEEDPIARRQLVEWSLAIHQYRSALKDSEGLGEDGRVLRGSAHYFLGEYEEALELLDERDTAACLMRVEALRALGRDWEGALESVALLLGKEDARVITLVGALALERGEHASAIQSFERAMKLAPLDAEALFGLGRALIESGERERGLALLQRHRELTPLLDALDFARRGLDLAPVHAPNQAALGDAWRSLVPADPSAYEHSDRAYLTALRLMAASEKVPVHLRRARLIHEYGAGVLAAAKILSVALEEFEDARLFVRAADYYMEAGVSAEAVSLLERALKLRPRDSAILSRLQQAKGGK